ncbi:hypothetical protein [Streptomyces incarnatus]|nr:hypothetical protein [Streptomyces incarnatus]
MTIHRAGRSRLAGATEYLQADARDPDAITIPGYGAVARKR